MNFLGLITYQIGDNITNADLATSCPASIVIGTRFTITDFVYLKKGQSKGLALAYKQGEPGAGQQCVLATANTTDAYMIQVSTTEYEVNKQLLVVEFDVDQGQTCQTGIDQTSAWNVLCIVDIINPAMNQKQLCPDLKTWCNGCQYCPNQVLCRNCVKPSTTPITNPK